MNNSQLHKVFQLALHYFKSSHNKAYDAELQHMVCILKAYKEVWSQENPGKPMDFTEVIRQEYQSVDEV